MLKDGNMLLHGEGAGKHRLNERREMGDICTEVGENGGVTSWGRLFVQFGSISLKDAYGGTV